MTPLAVGLTPSGLVYERSAAKLLRHHLFEGASGSGKTTAARDALFYLFRARPDVPTLVLDGVGTLAKDLAARIAAWIEARELEGKDMSRVRRRVLFLTIQPENETGVSFDLAKLRRKLDLHGFPRMETVHERVDAIMSTLAHTTEGSEDFRLVQTYGYAAFTALVAGHRPVTELPRLLTHGSEFYYLKLLEDIERHGHLDAYVRSQVDVLNELFSATAKSPVQFGVLAGSTRRNFAWMTVQYAPFFGRETVDYGAFHDSGGVLLVDAGQADPAMAGLFRRALYGIRNGHLAARGKTKPSIVVVDEQQGMNADLYAKHVAMARNRQDYHWFLFQSGQQIGERGSHYDEILSAMQHLVFFRPGTFDSAQKIATRLRIASLERKRLTTTSKSSGSAFVSGSSRQSGYSYNPKEELSINGGTADTGSHSDNESETESQERIRIGEQLEAVALKLMDLPTGTAYHVPEHGRVLRIRHRYRRISDDAHELAKENRRVQFVRMHVEDTRFAPAPAEAEPAPPPTTEAPQLPKTRKDRGKKDPKRHTPVDGDGAPTA